MAKRFMPDACTYTNDKGRPVTAQDTPLYTAWRYLKWGQAQSYDDIPLPNEWLRVIPALLGFQDMHAMQADLDKLYAEESSPELQAKLDNLFSAYFDQDRFFESIEVIDDDDVRYLLPNPFMPADTAQAKHSVGWMHVSVDRQQTVLSVKHASVTVERALQPASPSLRPICDWLATSNPFAEPIPSQALRDWLDKNRLPAELAENDDFLSALLSGVERNLEGALQFSLGDTLFDMVEGGAYIADGDGNCVGIDKVIAA